jgi:Fe-Mn family superoxide dismutase
MSFSLPPLGYAYDALEPYIDARTMEIHYTKHHQTYIDNLNKALIPYPQLQQESIDSLIAKLDTLPEAVRMAVRNQGGGHYNHSLFWKMMKKNGGGVPKGPAGEKIIKHFGSFESFQDQFNTAAKSVFGSGWAWLCVDDTEALSIVTTANQDSPLTHQKNPILGLDVWEHAYYLKYQNKRPDYISAWWHVINWEQVEENYEQGL